MSSQKQPGLRNPKSILKSPSKFPVHADAPLASDLPPFVPPLVPPSQATSTGNNVPTFTAPNATGFGAPRTLTAEQQARNRQLALQHATVLEQRKNAEALVLANIEELMEFPTSATHTAANPSLVDRARFQQLIPPFNTADYDELLTERNCADRCAYVFCPSMLSRDRSARANINRLHYNGTKVVTIKQAKLDQWCSKACARRALYIKVQLSESPAWERAGGHVGTIELLREGDDLVLEEKMKGLSLGDDTAGAETAEQQAKREGDLLQAAMEELALERGDTRTDSARRAAVMKHVLVENRTLAEPAPPSFATMSDGVEGHVPRVQRPGRRVSNNNKSSDDDDDDDDEDEQDDTDWVL